MCVRGHVSHVDRQHTLTFEPSTPHIGSRDENAVTWRQRELHNIRRVKRHLTHRDGLNAFLKEIVGRHGVVVHRRMQRVPYNRAVVPPGSVTHLEHSWDMTHVCALSLRHTLNVGQTWMNQDDGNTCAVVYFALSQRRVWHVTSTGAAEAQESVCVLSASLPSTS